MEDPVRVNSGVSKDRLDVIVTSPHLKKLTACGTGNAIYDPAVDAIFIDRSMIIPTELTLIGENGATSMVKIETLEFVVSYVNFILAHELGHRQSAVRPKRSAAFFHYGAHAGGAGDTRAEETADRFAVETILQGLQAGDTPAFMSNFNALGIVGLDHIELTANDRAAAEIYGSMLVMSKALLFSASPYSPFHFDENHPSFLSRAQNAITVTTKSPIGAILASHAPVILEDIARTERLADWDFKEINFGEPILRLAMRGGALWLGGHTLPGLDDNDQRERLYRMDGATLSELGGNSTPLTPHKQLIEEHLPDSDSYPGQWLKTIFDKGDVATGLPPPQAGDPLRSVSVFTHSKERPGFKSYGVGWIWSRDDGDQLSFLEHDISVAAKNEFDSDDVEFGIPQITSDGIAIPVRKPREAGTDSLLIMKLSISEKPAGARDEFYLSAESEDGFGAIALPVHTVVSMASDPRYRFDQIYGSTVVEAVRFANGAWWVIVIPPYGANESYRWQLWKLMDGSEPRLVAERPFMIGMAGASSEGSFQRDYDPYDARVLPVSSGKILISHQNDSVFLFDPITERLDIVFHPVVLGLEAIDLGKGIVIFWTPNALRAYVADLTKGKK